MWELLSGAAVRVFEQPSPAISVALHLRVWEGPEDTDAPAHACQAFIEVEYRYNVPSRCHMAIVEITRARGLPALPASSGGSNQETYVVVELGGAQHRSPGFEGDHPEWAFPVTFEGFDLNDPLVVKIFREVRGKSYWIGHVLLDFSHIREQKQLVGWHTIDMGPYATTFLAVGCADGRVRLLDVRTGVAAVSPLEHHTDGVSRMCFCAVGNFDYLVTASMDGSVLLWNTGFLTAAGRSATAINNTTGGLGTGTRRRPMKKFGPLNHAISSVAALEMFGSLRVIAGCHDSVAWMWSLDTAKIVANETWQGTLRKWMDSITVCGIVLCFIIIDVVSSLIFDLAIPENRKDCFGRQPLAEQVIEWIVLGVFTIDLTLHAIAEGKAYLYPFHFSNTCDVIIVSISVAVAAFQMGVDYSIPAYDSSGQYLPPSADVTVERYPEVCANFSKASSTSSANNTQKVFTAIRAARIVARIALALRILRAAIRIAKLARLLGGGKPKEFHGHRQAVMDVIVAPALAEDEAKNKPAGSYADRYRLFTASGDTLVHMYDIISDEIVGRPDIEGRPDQQTASV